MLSIIIIVIIVLVFSFIMALTLSGNDNRITDKERASMTDDVSALFDEDKNLEIKENNLNNNKNIIDDIDDDII